MPEDSRSSREADNGVYERPYTLDADRDLVPVLQRELGGRNDPGAGHQKHADRKLIVSQQVFDEVGISRLETSGSSSMVTTAGPSAAQRE